MPASFYRQTLHQRRQHCDARYTVTDVPFVECRGNDKPAPCSGEGGLVALLMAIAAGTSAEEKRWVEFKELAPQLCALSSELLQFPSTTCRAVARNPRDENPSSLEGPSDRQVWRADRALAVAAPEECIVEMTTAEGALDLEKIASAAAKAAAA